MTTVCKGAKYVSGKDVQMLLQLHCGCNMKDLCCVKCEAAVTVMFRPRLANRVGLVFGLQGRKTAIKLGSSVSRMLSLGCCTLSLLAECSRGDDIITF